MPKGADIFDERATRITLDDEGAGAFVVVRQENGESHIAIDPDEWPALRQAITQMICTAQGVEAPTLSGEPT